jgi:Raf kinase inhibitor-like YbhB/YbcL family protein
MKKRIFTSLFLVTSILSLPALAQQPPVLEQPGPAKDMMFDPVRPVAPAAEKIYPAIDVKVSGIKSGQLIADKFAYCKPDGKGQTVNADNISPAIHWLNAPEGVKSFVLLVVDPDVPADFSNANKADVEIRANTPRQDFYHWVLVDIPPTLLGLYEGADSKGIVPGGKQVGKRAYGINGKNDYSKVFTGTYGGYDGPCPPWNDLRMHHYHFTLYALDIPSLNLPSPITALQAKSAMDGHIIGKGEVVGTYTNNPRWLADLKNEALHPKVEEDIEGELFDPKAADAAAPVD